MKLIYSTSAVSYYQGDARALTALDAGAVQMVVTSPPYWNAREQYASWPTYDAYLADMAMVWGECYRVLCDGGRIAVNVPDGYGRPDGNGGEYLLIGDDTARAMRAAGFTLRGKIIWDKGATQSTAWGSWDSPSNPTLRDIHEVIIIGHKGRPDRAGASKAGDGETFKDATQSIWRIPPRPHNWHPAIFPSEIPQRLIKLYTLPGDVVLDPFAGTGTTVWAAESLGRVGVGVELSEDYARQAVGPLLAFALNEA